MQLFTMERCVFIYLFICTFFFADVETHPEVILSARLWRSLSHYVPELHSWSSRMKPHNWSWLMGRGLFVTNVIELVHSCWKAFIKKTVTENKRFGWSDFTKSKITINYDNSIFTYTSKSPIPRTYKHTNSYANTHTHTHTLKCHSYKSCHLQACVQRHVCLETFAVLKHSQHSTASSRNCTVHDVQNHTRQTADNSFNHKNMSWTALHIFGTKLTAKRLLLLLLTVKYNSVTS